MNIKKLVNYKKSEEFFQKFLAGTLEDSEFVSNESYFLDGTLDSFPIYFAKMNRDDDLKDSFMATLKYLSEKVICQERDIFMDETFWHSWLCLYQRDYLLTKYPEIADDYKKFTNIVLKDFDWENYIYKALLIAQYVQEHRPPSEAEHYYRLILNNLDIFNYIIKAEIFRNGQFLLNVMDIIEEEGLSKIVKAKIKNSTRTDLAADERYGRRVIQEFNASYPIVMAPMLTKDELKKHFLTYLSYYYREGDVVNEEEGWEEE